MQPISLRGNHQSIGLQHGEALRSAIEETIDVYMRLLFHGRTGDARQLALAYLSVIDSSLPHLAEEIRAIARGADRPTWQIAALNARTEIYHHIKAGMANECTAFYFPSTRLLGQNWDWVPEMEDLIVVMHLELDSGPAILQMTEPGIIGKIGFNDAGLGVCLNILTGPGQPPAVPVHVLLRHLLEQESFGEAQRALEALPPGTWSHILLADHEGRSAAIEICGDHYAEVRPTGSAVVHSNHFLTAHAESTSEATDPRFESSRCRLARGQRLAEVGDCDLNAFKHLLADRANLPFSICRDYHEEDGEILGTVASIVMDLSDRVLHITRGRCISNPWQRIDLPGT